MSVKDSCSKTRRWAGMDCGIGKGGGASCAGRGEAMASSSIVWVDDIFGIFEESQRDRMESRKIFF
jgi:hypothetical protein